MERTDGRLADGRTIHWYDPDGTARHADPDLRDLGDRAPAGELRHDPLTGEWIALATGRQKRTFRPSLADCPLCPSVDGRQSEVPSSDYCVVAFENRFPALGGALPIEAPSQRVDVPAIEELDVAAPATGHCEVVCFSSNHEGSFATLSADQARLVVDAWADRTSELEQQDDVEYVYIFENRGSEIGVTLQHPHGQLYAYPFVPPRATQELARAQRYHDSTGRSLFGDVIERELTDSVRIVTENATWVAFVPFAARWPMEVHFYPRVQRATIAELTDNERDDLADIYLKVLRAFDALYDAPLPYIAAWQQAPVHEGRDVAWLHLELFSLRRSADKLKYLAGTESGQGAFSCDVAPEVQAETLRGLL